MSRIKSLRDRIWSKKKRKCCERIIALSAYCSNRLGDFHKKKKKREINVFYKKKNVFFSNRLRFCCSHKCPISRLIRSTFKHHYISVGGGRKNKL